MLFLSAVKLLIVVMIFMHLKYDHRLFRALFTGPLAIAMATIIALLFLFGQLAVRLGG
jgi:cytochrome c oxidase subunit 4